MKRAVLLAAAAVWAAVAGWVQGAWGQDRDKLALRVCMQQNDPPLSMRIDGKPGGFDVALLGVIAERLGRAVQVQWFVSRDDPDSDLPRDANALLSDGKCLLVAEYPLTRNTLEQPRSPVVKLPPFEGATTDDRSRWIRTGGLAATRPYRLDTLAVVLPARDAGREVHRLADLDGLRIGVQIATLADAVAMQYGGGRLDQHVVHLPDAREVFGALQRGAVDAAFVELRSFDAWRLRHGSGGLFLSSYRHSIGFNMGFVGLASNAALIGQVDAVLGELQAQGVISSLASENGVTFIPPRSPAVAADVQRAALGGD
ncbi:MAG TPA: transporter substrate-binding domain-containing protein [Rhodopila sp.]|nr:transporter substrate-binding domain-containing protein [Rhodopila sp.]